MSNYRFILEPYSSSKSRFNCPSCEEPKTFTRYIDLEKNEYVAEEVGICNRLQKCSYHYPPKAYFEDKETFSGISPDKPQRKRLKLKPNFLDFTEKDNLPPTFIPKDLFLKSINKKKENNFLLYLEKVLNNEALDEIQTRYKIGTSEKWKGATVFWQVDENFQIRTGKLMLYSRTTGKKSKVNWVHSVLKLKDYNLKQCLFGLHLLNSDQTKKIAIVESEKTAIIASIAFPEFIWMATGGLMNLKYDLLKPLAKRKVILFPDAGCYDLWSEKVKDLPNNIHFMISDLVENKSSDKEKEEGWDIADYIIPIYLERKNIAV